MSPVTQDHLDSTELSISSSDEVHTSSNAELNTSSCASSPVDGYRLLFARLIPSNWPARAAIANAREAGSVYHSSFITDTEYRGDPHTPCFYLALGGLPDHLDVGWRIGRGYKSTEGDKVDPLLNTDDEDIAVLHARFGWTDQSPSFSLIIMSEQHNLCTSNGRDFSTGSRHIPFRNTVLIGSCAFTLQYVQRNPTEETFFQAELRLLINGIFERRQANGSERGVVLMTPRGCLDKHKVKLEDSEGAKSIGEFKGQRRSFKKAKIGLLRPNPPGTI